MENCPIARFVRRRRKEARPAELAAAALEVFTEKGFAATRLEDIATRAGASKGTVYLYFENKEALFKAAVESAMLPALEAAEATAADTAKPAAEMMREFIFGWWRMVGSTAAGGVPKLLVAESHNFPEAAQWFHDHIISRAHGAMVRIVELGISRGEFRAMDARIAARIVFAPIFSFLLWRRSFGPCMPDLPEPEVFLDYAVDILTNGLAVREPAK
jgi:AcrR family transcriptional regulator